MEQVSIIIRPATDADAVAIADFSRMTFEESFAPFNTAENMHKFMEEQFSRTKLVAELYDKTNHFFVADDGGEIVGYLKLKNSRNLEQFPDLPCMELARIYTTQKKIGKGIGKSLMEKAVETASSLNKKILWLGVWEHNERAITFYKKWGFERFSEHAFVLGEDVQTDWLMKKDL